MIEDKYARVKYIHQLILAGDLSDAESEATKFVEDYPQSVTGIFFLGYAFHYQNNGNSAEHYFKKIPVSFRYYPLTVRSLFHIYWDRGDITQAIRQLKKGLAEAEDDPTNPEWQEVIEDFNEIKSEMIEKGVWIDVGEEE